MSAASCRIDFRRGTNATSSGARDDEHLRAPAGRRGGRARRSRGTGPSPRSRTATRGRAGSRTSARRRRARRGAGRARAGGSRKAATVAPANASAKRCAGTRQPFGIREPQRREQQRRELRPAGERDRRAARPGGGGEPEAPDQEGGHDRVVRVRVRDVERERIGRPGERERSREPRPAEAPPDEREPEHAERVEEERGRVRSPELVPLPGPAEDRVAGQVGEVGHRARRCRPRGFDASQRPLVWIRSRISPSASAMPHGCRSSCTGMWPYGISPFAIRFAPTTPAKPTSITLRCASTLSPTRNPARKTAAAASSQTGQTGRPARGGRSRRAIQTQRPSR